MGNEAALLLVTKQAEPINDLFDDLKIGHVSDILHLDYLLISFRLRR